MGIVAGRLKEQFHRPVVVFARGEDGLLKGSARSLPGIHIRDLLDLLDRSHPEMILKFGGHAMAAGLTITEGMFEIFRDAFQQELERSVDPGLFQEVVSVDGGLNAQERTAETASLLRWAGPWGQGFPEPSFSDPFLVVQCRIVGANHLKLVLDDAEGGGRYDAIHFNHGEVTTLRTGDRVRMVYRLDLNYWQGREQLQLMVEQIWRD